MIYTAPNQETATRGIRGICDEMRGKYKYAIRSWHDNRDELTGNFEFPMEIRKIIHTSNTIENLDREIRKYTKIKV